MACSDINIRAAMGAAAGGDFSYVGYDASDPNGAYADDPGFSFIQFTDITGGDDDWIFEPGAQELPVGFYRYRYQTELTVPPLCQDEAFQTFEVVDPRCPGGDFNIITCETNDPSFFVFGQFGTASTCGAVTLGTLENTDSPSGPGGSNVSGPFFNFDPETNDVDDHTFVHTSADPAVTGGFTLAGDCDNCNPSATGVITVRPDINLSNNDITIDCGIDPCDYAIDGLINILTYSGRPEPYEGKWRLISAPSSPVELGVNGNFGFYTPGDELSPNGPNNNVPNEISLFVDWTNAPAGDYVLEYCVFPDNIPTENQAPGAGSTPCRNCRQATVTIIQCTEPCDGDVTTADYWTDLVNPDYGFLDGDDMWFNLNDVTIDGTDYLGGSQPFQPMGNSQSSTGGISSYDALITFLQGIVPAGFDVNLSSHRDGAKHQFMEISYPSCWDFTIEYALTVGAGRETYRLRPGFIEWSIDGGFTFMPLTGSGDRFDYGGNTGDPVANEVTTNIC